MNINQLNQSIAGHKKRTRRGRGAASGLGKTSGFGQKGRGQRTGKNYLRGYVGGQSNLRTRLPKRGFSNAAFKVEYVPVNLDFLEKNFESGAVVGPAEINAKGISVRRGDLVKILGVGELTKKLTIKAHACSQAAAAKIEKAGGKLEPLPNQRAEKRAKKLATAAAKDGE